MHRSTKMVMIYRVLLAVIFSTAVDISFSAFNGYTLRTDALILALLDGIFLTAFVAPTFLILQWLRRFDGVRTLSNKAPWLITALAGWAPIEIVCLWRGHAFTDLLIQGAVIGSIL